MKNSSAKHKKIDAGAATKGIINILGAKAEQLLHR
jgi:hypothetical protein